jgi:maltose O-acetyltransferase
MNILSIIRQKKNEYYINNLVKNGLRLGKNVWILEGCFIDPSHCYLISIGDNSILCPNVRLIAHDASTKSILGYSKIGTIKIKENCFIGDSTIILPGVCIGPNSIVGAGSVVTKSVPADIVVAGNPARMISTLDDYLAKIKNNCSQKTIFPYLPASDDMDRGKIEEIFMAADSSIGFMR